MNPYIKVSCKKNFLILPSDKLVELYNKKNKNEQIDRQNCFTSGKTAMHQSKVVEHYMSSLMLYENQKLKALQILPELDFSFGGY